MNIVIVLVSLVILSIIYFINGPNPNTSAMNTFSKFNFKSEVEKGFKKVDCQTTDLYCFANSDCMKICKINDRFACIKGICKLDKDEIVSDFKKEPCNNENGQFTFFVGDTAFGRFVNLCKSMDPGIAISNNVNLMCKDGEDNSKINYLIKNPQISDCKNCPKKILVPATFSKREHVECNNQFYDMVKY